MTLLSHGYRARAAMDEDDLNVMRDICGKCIVDIGGHPAFQRLLEMFEDEIKSIDTDIEGLRREDRYAEQNAKYREDRPNA